MWLHAGFSAKGSRSLHPLLSFKAHVFWSCLVCAGVSTGARFKRYRDRRKLSPLVQATISFDLILRFVEDRLIFKPFAAELGIKSPCVPVPVAAEDVGQHVSARRHAFERESLPATNVERSFVSSNFVTPADHDHGVLAVTVF